MSKIGIWFRALFLGVVAAVVVWFFTDAPPQPHKTVNVEGNNEHNGIISSNKSVAGKSPTTATFTKARAIDYHNPNRPDLEAILLAFGDDNLGNKLASGFVQFVRDVEDNQFNADFNNTDLVKGWMRSPDRGMKEVNEAMSRLETDEFPEFKIELMQVAGNLGGQNSAARELAFREIRNNVVHQATSPTDKSEVVVSKVVPYVITAFRVFLENAPDPESALDGTLDSMAIQPDPLVRMGILSTFLREHPQMEMQLMDDMKNRGLGNPQEEFDSHNAEVTGERSGA